MVLEIGAPHADGALGQGQFLVGDHQLGVDLVAEAQARAVGARAVGGVEGEGAGLDLVQGQGVVVGAGALLGEAAAPRGVRLVEVHAVDDDEAVGQAQGRFHRVGEALADAAAHDEAVHDDLDGVLELLLQFRRVLQAHGLAVDDGARVAVGFEFVEQVLVLALAAAHDWREHLEAGAVVHGAHPVDDLLGRLGLDAGPALGAVGDPGARVQQAQVVVDLGDGADRGTGVAGRGLLVDGHRRGQPLDEVDVGLVHLPQELTGVGGQGLHVAPLSLGEDRVEGQGGLARAGQAREDDHRVPGQGQADILEVVLAGALDH